MIIIMKLKLPIELNHENEELLMINERIAYCIRSSKCTVHYTPGKIFLLTAVASFDGVSVIIGDVPRRGLRRTPSAASSVHVP